MFTQTDLGAKSIRNFGILCLTDFVISIVLLLGGVEIDKVVVVFIFLSITTFLFMFKKFQRDLYFEIERKRELEENTVE